MIEGNHDRIQDLQGLFETITPLTNVHVGGQLFVLCHFCMAIWNQSHRGAIHLYGHSHGGAEEWLNKAMPTRKSMDVGIDNAAKIFGGGEEGYRPFHVDKIMEIMVASDFATVQ